MDMTKGVKLYQLAEKSCMINKLKELRKTVAEIRGYEIGGGFYGIFRALGAEMDRKKGLSNQWYPVTGLTAYEQAQKIDNLLKNIEHICSEVDSEKHYFGMLKELAGEMTQRHGKFGER